MKLGFLESLALIFVTLKLTGFIGWPWLWVLSPLWLPFVVFMTVILLFAVMGSFK